jgi:hypothetical protein
MNERRLHSVANGTKRTFAVMQQFGRFRGEADMRDAVASTAIVVNDP